MSVRNLTSFPRSPQLERVSSQNSLTRELSRLKTRVAELESTPHHIKLKEQSENVQKLKERIRLLEGQYSQTKEEKDSLQTQFYSSLVLLDTFNDHQKKREPLFDQFAEGSGQLTGELNTLSEMLEADESRKSKSSEAVSRTIDELSKMADSMQKQNKETELRTSKNLSALKTDFDVTLKTSRRLGQKAKNQLAAFEQGLARVHQTLANMRDTQARQQQRREAQRRNQESNCTIL